MAVNNISITQEVHQKPSVDATQHIIESEQKRSKDPQIQQMSHESIAALLDSVADEINENAAQIQCISFGGESFAERTEDAICAGMFGAILKMSESAKDYLLLKDLIVELRYRLKISAPADPIAKQCQPNALQGANDAVWVAQVGVSCIKNNISPILASIEAMSHVGGMNAKEITKRMDAIQKLAQVGVRTADDMENTMDCERESMQEKLSEMEAIV